MSKTWLITGASRGLGLEMAKAALRAGERVAATGRRQSTLLAALGPDSERLQCLELDVADADGASRAVEAVRAKLGPVDVLMNNAGYGHLGFFEETTREDVESQFTTNLFGVFNVTRAVLPVMRAARSGRIFNLSSIAGIRGAEFGSLYSASKFALEGFSESLAGEVAPFGIFVTIVEPGPFRTDFLTPESLRYAARQVADYAARRAQLRASFEQRDGQQPGDPAKLAEALLRLAAEAAPPRRFLAGAFAVRTADEKLAAMRSEFDRWRELSLATDYRT